LDLLEDGVGGGGPQEGMRLGVVGVGEVADPGDELTD